MLIEEQFRAWVLAVPEMAALIGDRLSPIFLKPGETMPAATYSRTGTRYELDLEDNRIEFPDLELTVWGFEYLAIKQAVAATTIALQQQRVTANTPQAVSITNELDVFDDKYLHADGVGLPGTRIECQLIKL